MTVGIDSGKPAQLDRYTEVVEEVLQLGQNDGMTLGDPRSNDVDVGSVLYFAATAPAVEVHPDFGFLDRDDRIDPVIKGHDRQLRGQQLPDPIREQRLELAVVHEAVEHGGPLLDLGGPDPEPGHRRQELVPLGLVCGGVEAEVIRINILRREKIILVPGQELPLGAPDFQLHAVVVEPVVRRGAEDIEDEPVAVCGQIDLIIH